MCSVGRAAAAGNANIAQEVLIDRTKKEGKKESRAWQGWTFGIFPVSVGVPVGSGCFPGSVSSGRVCFFIYSFGAYAHARLETMTISYQYETSKKDSTFNKAPLSGRAVGAAVPCRAAPKKWPTGQKEGVSTDQTGGGTGLKVVCIVEASAGRKEWSHAVWRRR